MKQRPAMYQRPAKPMFKPVPQRNWRERVLEPVTITAPVVVDAGTECHVTPATVAERMADYAGDIAGLRVLEPSAGTGNLLRAILAAGAGLGDITAVEMHTKLAAIASEIAPTICADFLEWAQGDGASLRFDRVVMNPPFRKVKAHISAARSLLADGGELIALVPITYDANDCETLEELPDDTFANAKVRTKIVSIPAR